jgi:hypothetical protein
MSMSSRCLVVLLGFVLIQACSSSTSYAPDASTGTFDTSGGGGATGADASGEVGSTSVGGGPDAAQVVTFTQVYTTVIGRRCSPCHTTSSGMGVSLGHLDMTTQAAAFMNLVNVPAAGVECSGKGTRVVPGKEDDSVMYLKISLDDPTPCGAKMPLGLPALPQEEADLIEDWIKGGAQNN